MSYTCRECGQGYEVTDTERAFQKEMGVPAPRSCPACRLMRRMNERNARKLYWRTCDATSKRILSQYHSDHTFPVYSPEAWWGDTWDGLDYGQDIDFGKPFFPQFQALKNRVPHQARFVIGSTMENSEYTNCAGFMKNCYLCFEADYNEDCEYSNRIYHCKDMVDCSNCYESEVCYESVDCVAGNRLFYSQDCQNCSESLFLKNCIGCSDCIGCINQRQKKYMILNEQLTKEEYEKRASSLELNTVEGREAFRKQCTAFFLTQPQKAVQAERNENCVGDHLFDSKNSTDCLDCKDLEDCMHCAKVAMGVKACVDYTSWGDKAERLYQCAACGNNAFNLMFCTTCTTNNSDLAYCDGCTGCGNCFGCVGLKKKQNCILNRQYTKKHYEELVPQLIHVMRKHGEYGEFFPKDVCPYGYNETIAMEYFPLTKAEAVKRGYKWRDEREEKPDVPKVIPAAQLPSAVTDVPDDVLNWAITSEETGRPFRITKQELLFYRANDIPLPRFHPEERHEQRLLLRPPRKLWERNCAKCGKNIPSTYAPERPEIMFCEECYLAAVY
ncbi:MAG: hypothetical protein AAB728_00230 [Patescibacteria group bacterium]